MVSQVFESVALYSLSNNAMHEGRPLFMDPVRGCWSDSPKPWRSLISWRTPRSANKPYSLFTTAGVEIGTIEISLSDEWK